jgi:hypothetical protein
VAVCRIHGYLGLDQDWAQLGGQDSSVDIKKMINRSLLSHMEKLASDSITGRKALGSILASTAKGAQHERLLNLVSPCEIIKIY